MNNAPVREANWEGLFAAAVREQDPLLAARRFRSAKDAIMDYIEDSFDSASLSERRMLLAALNTITELERSSRPSALRLSPILPGAGHAA